MVANTPDVIISAMRNAIEYSVIESVNVFWIANINVLDSVEKSVLRAVELKDARTMKKAFSKYFLGMKMTKMQYSFYWKIVVTQYKVDLLNYGSKFKLRKIRVSSILNVHFAKLRSRIALD